MPARNSSLKPSAISGGRPSAVRPVAVSATWVATDTSRSAAEVTSSTREPRNRAPVRAGRQVVERVAGVRERPQGRPQQGLQVVELGGAHSSASHSAARASSSGVVSPRRMAVLARMLAIVRVGCAA